MCMRNALALLLLLVPAAAEAHRVKVFAVAEGRTISGRVYFPGGGRAKGVTVTFLAPDDTKLGEAVTDGQGEFAFEATVRCDHQAVVDTGDGHRATTTVPADTLDPALPEGPGAAPHDPDATAPHAHDATTTDLETVVDRAVARHIRPLREQLDAYEERRRLHDILGGIGIIFGICGVAAYLLSKRGQRVDP